MNLGLNLANNHQLSPTTVVGTANNKDKSIAEGIHRVTLEPNAPIMLDNDRDLSDDEFRTLDAQLGVGNGGIVKKVLHIPTNTVMARKLIHLDIKPETRRNIKRELKILGACQHPNIVGYYGAFDDGKGELSIIMEYMDCGALDDVCKTVGALPENVLGAVTVGVLNGLLYLKTQKVMHRDVKPSNILLSADGSVKVCDFGVSGTIDLNSMAKSFVGTQSYMAPERLQGKPYTSQSDVWSLGLSLLELATGKYPLQPEKGRVPTLFELLEIIVKNDPPQLPTEGDFSADFRSFIHDCLLKDSSRRPSPLDLLGHNWIVRAKENPFDLAGWISQHNGKLSK